MGLIGYFNLSPPRVLDLILEIGSCHMALHWRFFMDLLRCSPWGTAAMNRGKGKARATEDWASVEVDAVGDAASQSGDRVLSQVLGFKFGYYRVSHCITSRSLSLTSQSSDQDSMPMGLVYMAALLVKDGFIGLPDLLPFVRRLLPHIIDSS
jgi:THO complex subunit 2